MGTRSEVRLLVEYGRRSKTPGLSRGSNEDIWAPLIRVNMLTGGIGSRGS